MCLIEGSLYTSEARLLFHTVNTMVTLSFSPCICCPSLFLIVFPHIFSVSLKSTAIILNQDVFTDFFSSSNLENRVIIMCVCAYLCGCAWQRGCSGGISVNLAALCGILFTNYIFWDVFFLFCSVFQYPLAAVISFYAPLKVLWKYFYFLIFFLSVILSHHLLPPCSS